MFMWYLGQPTYLNIDENTMDEIRNIKIAILRNGNVW